MHLHANICVAVVIARVETQSYKQKHTALMITKLWELELAIVTLANHTGWFKARNIHCIYSQTREKRNAHDDQMRNNRQKKIRVQQQQQTKLTVRERPTWKMHIRLEWIRRNGTRTGVVGWIKMKLKSSKIETQCYTIVIHSTLNGYCFHTCLPFLLLPLPNSRPLLLICTKNCAHTPHWDSNRIVRSFFFLLS